MNDYDQPGYDRIRINFEDGSFVILTISKHLTDRQLKMGKAQLARIAASLGLKHHPKMGIEIAPSKLRPKL